MKLADASHHDLPRGDRDHNPRDISLLALIREDLRTHDDDLLAPGFWAVCLHRLGNARMNVRIGALRAPLSAAYQAAFHGVIALWGIDIPYNVQIGRRLRIEHHGCLMIGARSIGDDVTIRHSVTIGLQQRGGSAFPVIGNRVEIGPGACIVGGIRVGDDAYIGPNTVVARHVPAGTALIGIPPRKVNLEQLQGVTPAAAVPTAPSADVPSPAPNSASLDGSSAAVAPAIAPVVSLPSARLAPDAADSGADANTSNVAPVSTLPSARSASVESADSRTTEVGVSGAAPVTALPSARLASSEPSSGEHAPSATSISSVIPAVMVNVARS